MIPIAMPGMSYWDAYMLPVQIRKYMINTHFRLKEKQQQQQQDNPRTGMQALAQRAPAKPLPKPNYLGKPQR